MNLPDVASFQKESLQWLTTNPPVLTGGALVASFLVFWLASKMFARERGIIKNAALAYLYVGVSILILGVTLSILSAAMPEHGSSLTYLMLLASVVILFVIIMHVYTIDIIRTFTLLSISAIGTALAAFGLLMAIGARPVPELFG